MTKIYFRGTRQQAVDVARRLKDALIGRASDPNQLARGVFLAVGFAALSDIKNDYVTKADGGTGEDGVKWPPLQPATIARRRLGPGEATALKAKAGMKPREPFGRHKGLLTPDERKRWNKIYKAKLQRFAVSKPPEEARKRAEQIAWATLKAQGANTKGKTKISVYANRVVKILRDTGILFNSLSPGEIVGTEYVKPSIEGGDEQIFQTIENGVMVGTTVAYAAAHQNGVPEKNLPARPFLPKEQAPQIWQERWEAVAGDAIDVAIEMAYRQGAA